MITNQKIHNTSIVTKLRRYQFSKNFNVQLTSVSVAKAPFGHVRGVYQEGDQAHKMEIFRSKIFPSHH